MTTRINLLFFTIAIICLASATFSEADALNCFITSLCPNQAFHCSESCRAQGFPLGGNCVEGMAECCCIKNV
ncbi:hypothetical protein P8452_12970 [Trifolium repens]|nr:hypothetical protein P8452_12937 [Trifolium repens]WJX23781.1 hypothetical protein P8452_12970 [Trifolium repens]